MTKEYKRYIIRRHNATACLNSIGWKVSVSNGEVAKNLFQNDRNLNAYIAVLVNGKPSSFEPYYEDRPILYGDVELLECPVDNLIGSIK